MTRKLTNQGNERVVRADYMPGVPSVSVYGPTISNPAASGTVQLNAAVGGSDPFSMLDAANNGVRIKVAGRYRVAGQVSFSGSTLGTYRTAGISKNGTTVITANEDPVGSAAHAVWIQLPPQIIDCAVGDLLTLTWGQDAGATGAVQGGASSSWLTVDYIGPAINMVREKPVISYVTPAQFAGLTPVDGDEVYLIADAAAGVVWHMRYNAASSSAYKWEYLGGPPLEAETITADAGTTSVWVKDARTGIVIPRGGDYMIHYNGSWYSAGSVAEALAMGVDLSTASNPGVQHSNNIGAPNYSTQGAAVRKMTGLAASATIQGAWLSGAGGPITAQARQLLVWPVRIS